ncbi:MAG: hypothetical protein ABEJ23_08130 [Haloarculaceae archaeon]
MAFRTVPLGRTGIVTVVVLLAALLAATGSAAAHNPACIQTGHADGPHYAKDTASHTAYVHNPTLRDPKSAESRYPDNANSIYNRDGGCSVGNSQSPYSDN